MREMKPYILIAALALSVALVGCGDGLNDDIPSFAECPGETVCNFSLGRCE